MGRRHIYREDIAGPTWLYRLYDSGASLLYVGVTNRPQERLISHRRSKPWWPQVARVEWLWHESRKQAFLAERESIGTDRPLHNVARPKGASI